MNNETFTESGRLSVTYGPDRVDLTILTDATSLTIHLDPSQVQSLGTGLSAWASGRGVGL